MNLGLSELLETTHLLFGDHPGAIPPGDTSSIFVELGLAFLGTAWSLGDLKGYLEDTLVRCSDLKPRQYKLINRKTKRRRIDFRVRVLDKETKLFKPTKGN